MSQELPNVSKEFQKKYGGPYPKEQQAKRRKQVFHLHFEKGYSALKIAELLGVNRNTINEDIKALYSEMSEEIGNKNLINWFIKQIY